MSQLLHEAYAKFDSVNANDPNLERIDGREVPKELLYAQRMTSTLMDFAPGASEALKLTARCQHIRRWEIPRDDYEMNRKGYLKWRQELKKFHAEVATEILTVIGYSKEIIERVRFLLLKKQLKKDSETQILEDVICLVFLKYYFEPFMVKHDDPKIVSILRKTWHKMSPKGQSVAMKIQLSHKSHRLLDEAISG